MRHQLLAIGCAVLATACYSGARAARDVNVAWRGRARAELVARLGDPADTQAQPDGTTVLRWIHRGQHLERLPSGRFDVSLTPTSVDVEAELQPGVVQQVEYLVASAVVDPRGAVVSFDSSWLAAGIPRGQNLRTGIVFGLHGGMGWLDDATSPLPSLGLYIGGMLGRRLALLGAYAFVNGRDGDDYVNGHSWAVAVQYWPLARVAVRAGPALVLDDDPGGDVELAPGAVGALSLAVVRAGAFVLDLRVDSTVSTAGGFAVLGIGVNVN